MILDVYHVDAFAKQIFEGNPAAVIVLESWLPDALMQAIAAELNLSETAFVVPRHDGDFRIRWFTPTVEVRLCGHATLASAHVLYEHLNYPTATLRFHSLSGTLTCTPDNHGIRLDFPTQKIEPIADDETVIRALGRRPLCLYSGEDLVALYEDASQITILEPDLAALSKLPYRGIIAAADGHGTDYDFVCRFFAPASGIDEDPVTGSAYTKLAPLFAEKLDRTTMLARQLSKRGGDVHIELHGERVFLSGKAITVMQSRMELPF